MWMLVKTVHNTKHDAKKDQMIDDPEKYTRIAYICMQTHATNTHTLSLSLTHTHIHTHRQTDTHKTHSKHRHRHRHRHRHTLLTTEAKGDKGKALREGKRAQIFERN